MKAVLKSITQLRRNRSSKQTRSAVPVPVIEALEPRQLLSAAVGGAAGVLALQAEATAAMRATIHAASPAAVGVTTTVVTSSAASNTSIYGTPVTYTATVAGNSPTGDVTFFDGSASLGLGAEGAGGVWTLTISSLTAGSHNITAVYEGDTNNAGSTSPINTATVTPKALAVTGISAANKVYDGATTATLNTSAAALLGVETADAAHVALVASGATGAFAGKNAGTAVAVAVSGLTLSGSAAGNYTVTAPTNVTANITAKPLTLTGVTAVSKTYDGTVAATLNFSGSVISGILASDLATVTLVTSGTTALFGDKNVGTAVAVTVTGVTLSGGAAANYSVTQPTGITGNITAKALTVTGITASNKIYDGTAGAVITTARAQLAGVVAADAANVTLVQTAPAGVFSSANAGTGVTVAVSGFSISGGAAGNYTLAAPTTTANITPLTITASGVTAANKVYDGTSAAVINTSLGTLTGVLAGDVAHVTISSATGTFNNANVGSNKTVTANVSLAGTAGGNYAVAPLTVTANITPKTLTVTGVTADRAYDGTTKGAALRTTGAVLVGLATGDAGKVTVVSHGFVTAAFGNAAAGTTLAVNVTGLTLGGSAGMNYELTQPSITAHITPKAITVTGITGHDKMYDGTTAGAVTVTNPKLVGVLPADSAHVTLVAGAAVGTFSSVNVGRNITETVSGLTLSGTAAGNYALTQPVTKANITPKALTVTGLTATPKVFDGTTTVSLSVGGAVLAGVVAGDVGNVNLNASAATGVFTSPNVDNAVPVTVKGLTLWGGAIKNYTLTQPTPTAAISARPITVSGVTASDKVYNGLATATVNMTNAVLAGFLPADKNHIKLETAGATGTFSSQNVGTHVTVTVNGLTLSGPAATNYLITAPTTTANITPKTLTVTGITAIKTYDGTTATTLNTAGAVLAGVVTADSGNVTLDTIAATVGSYTSANAGTYQLAVSGLTIGGSAAANYTLTQPTITATIRLKALTVTGITAGNKVYDGNTSAVVDTSAAVISGVLAADDGNVTLVTTGATGAFSGKNAGTGLTVTTGGLTLSGSAAANYFVTPPTTTANITPKSLTVTGITANNKVYDGTNVATANTGGAVLSGVLAADLAHVTIASTTGTFSGADVGTDLTVIITVNLGGTAGGNYTVIQPTSTANITPLAITVSGITADKTYDGTTAATLNLSGAALHGVLAGDSANVAIQGTAGTFSGANAATGLTVTPTNLILSGTMAGNYTLTLPAITANITPKALTVTGITAADKVADGTTAAVINTLDATLVGVVTADIDNVDLIVTNAVGTFSQSAPGTNLTVAISGLTITGSAIGNYTLTQPATTASIT